MCRKQKDVSEGEIHNPSELSEQSSPLIISEYDKKAEQSPANESHTADCMQDPTTAAALGTFNLVGLVWGQQIRLPIAIMCPSVQDEVQQHRNKAVLMKSGPFLLNAPSRTTNI